MQPMKSLMIRNLTPRLPERGKIKIGIKGELRTSRAGNEFQPPVKLDHFVVTTLQRGPDGPYQRDEAIHRMLGDKPTRIPVRLLYDDIELNFQSRYVCFVGRAMWCSGDGSTAMRLKGDGPEREPVTCICPRVDQAYQGKDKCKPNGNLSVIIDGVDAVGGVWSFRTTSYNSIVGIYSSLALIKRITGGPLAGIPLDLTVGPKSVSSPTDGKMQTIYVVGLEYRGSPKDLQQIGYETAAAQVQHKLRIEDIENHARRLLLSAPAPAGLGEDEPDDVTDEFYPEQAAEAEGAKLVGGNGNGSGHPTLTAPAAVDAQPASTTAAPEASPPATHAPAEQPPKRGRGRPPKNAAPTQPTSGDGEAAPPPLTPPPGATAGTTVQMPPIPDQLRRTRETMQPAATSPAPGPQPGASQPAPAADFF